MSGNAQQETVKYAEIWAFSDPYFSQYGPNCIRILPYLENMDTILPTSGKI